MTIIMTICYDMMIFLLYDNDDTDMELNSSNVNLMVLNWSLYLADLTSIENDQLADV